MIFSTHRSIACLCFALGFSSVTMVPCGVFLAVQHRLSFITDYPHAHRYYLTSCLLAWTASFAGSYLFVRAMVQRANRKDKNKRMVIPSEDASSFFAAYFARGIGFGVVLVSTLARYMRGPSNPWYLVLRDVASGYSLYVMVWLWWCFPPPTPRIAEHQDRVNTNTGVVVGNVLSDDTTAGATNRMDELRRPLLVATPV